MLGKQGRGTGHLQEGKDALAGKPPVAPEPRKEEHQSAADEASSPELVARAEAPLVAVGEAANERMRSLCAEIDRQRAEGVYPGD